MVHDFIDRARNYFDDPSSSIDTEEREHFRRFLDFKQKMSQAREKVRIDLDNIEQLFGLVEISQRLGLATPETRESTVYVIAKTLELATGSTRSDRIEFAPNTRILGKRGGNVPGGFTFSGATGYQIYSAEMYHYFASLASGGLDDPDREGTRSNTFITFNYDLILDDSLRRVGLTPNYYLPGSNSHPEVNNNSTTSCTILKLHGSTNWSICSHSGCNRNVVVFDGKVTAAPSELRSRVCPTCNTAAFQPMLIPPSWDKSEYSAIMRPIWRKAVEELQLASRICVIGYSMPEADSFFKYLLALALSANHNLYKFIVVDKNPHIAAKYEDLLDPLFRERRLSIFGDPGGFSSFLARGLSASTLGRGELIGGDLSRR